MASTKEYKNFILENLELDDITFRPMMGEYLIYYKKWRHLKLVPSH